MRASGWAAVVLAAFSVSGSGTVAGTVIDARGVRVAGAVVEAWSAEPQRGCCGGPARLAQAVSGADGSFVLSGVPTGARVVARVGVSGLGAATVESPDSCEIRLGASRTVEMTLVDELGQRVPGATARAILLARGYPLPMTEIDVQGDDDASLRIGPIAAEYELVVEARARGRRATRSSVVRTDECVFVLPAGSTWSGIVVDASGHAVSGAQVDVATGDGTRVQAVSGFDGRFEVDGLSDRPTRLIIRRDGFETAVSDGTSSTVVLRRRVPLSGRVTPARAGLTAVVVDGASRHRVRVNADGTFRFANAPAVGRLEIQEEGVTLVELPCAPGGRDLEVRLP